MNKVFGRLKSDARIISPTEQQQQQQQQRKKQQHREQPPTGARPAPDRPHIERSNFANGICIVCEESLSLTLTYTEHILELSCEHVAHETCIYEWTKSAAGKGCCPDCGTRLALTNVEPDGQREQREPPAPACDHVSASSIATTQQTLRKRSTSPPPQHQHQHDSATLEALLKHRETINAERGYQQPTSDSYGDDDSASMARTVPAYINRPRSVRNPIPAPVVSVKCEFQTLTRLNRVQDISCLVTIEVPKGKWKPRHSDLLSLPTRVTDTRSMQSEDSDDTDELDEMALRLKDVAAQLYIRVPDWDQLDFQTFGPLHIYGKLSVSKTGDSWQVLDCYLFTKLLICTLEKKGKNPALPPMPHLKGRIAIKDGVESVELVSGSDKRLRLALLNEPKLPEFYLEFLTSRQCAEWKGKIDGIISASTLRSSELSSLRSRHSAEAVDEAGFPASYRPAFVPDTIHVPMDIIIVVPTSASTHEIKFNAIRDAVRFVVRTLGPDDRLGLVAFGSENCAILALLADKSWSGWENAIGTIRAVKGKDARAGPIEGAGIAMDMFIRRKTLNPVSSMLLISDTTPSEVEDANFFMSRVEAAKVSIYCFGLGKIHKAEQMVELSRRTRGSYTYVPEWPSLRTCIAGAVGALSSTSHQLATLKVRIPDGLRGSFSAIDGGVEVVRKPGGREAEVMLGDLRFGDRRDVLVKLRIEPQARCETVTPRDEVEAFIQNLEHRSDSASTTSSDSIDQELPLLEVDMIHRDIMRGGRETSLPDIHYVTVTTQSSSSRLPAQTRNPLVLQRAFEVLTAHQLKNAIDSASKGRFSEAHAHLWSTRNLVRSFRKDGTITVPQSPAPAPKGKLPPIPSTRPAPSPTSAPPLHPADDNSPPVHPAHRERSRSRSPKMGSQPRPIPETKLVPDELSSTMLALDAVLTDALEELVQPGVFAQDHKKAILQAIGVITTQRAYTDRTDIEALWASRIEGTTRMLKASANWRQVREELQT